MTNRSDSPDFSWGRMIILPNPFSQRLLNWKKRNSSVLRRYAPQNHPKQQTENSSPYLYAGLRLDDDRHLCKWKKHTHPRSGKYLLVKILAISPGHVGRVTNLISAAYGRRKDVDDRTIDTHIKTDSS